MCFVLDGLASAANVGNIFRLADALRVAHVYICGQGVNLKGGRFRRAAKGITQWVPHTQAPDAAAVVRDLRIRGYHAMGIELAPRSVTLATAVFATPLALILGKESTGISPAVLSLCDSVVALPMLGMGNSINASNALAAVSYAAYTALSGETRAPGAMADAGGPK